MKTSYKGRAFIAREEGVVLTAYQDSVGVWTIGIGHTTAAGPPAVTQGLTLTLAEAFDLFAKDIAKYEARVNAALTVSVSQNVFDACVSFDYNTGTINRASFVKLLNSGDLAGAGDGMMAWNKPPEIIGRRHREQVLFLTGDYGPTGTIPVWQKQGGKPSSMALPPDTAPAPAPPVQPPAPAPAPTPQPKPVPKGFVQLVLDLIAAIFFKRS